MLHVWIVYLHEVKNGYIQREMTWYKYSRLMEHLGMYVPQNHIRKLTFDVVVIGVGSPNLG